MKSPSLRQTAEAILRAPGVSPEAKAEILALSIQGRAEIIATGLRARENPRPRKPSYPRKEKP